METDSGIESTIEPDLQDEPEIKIETTTIAETSDPLDIFIKEECDDTYLDISKIKFQTKDFNTNDEQTQNRKIASAQRKAFNRAKETQEQRRQRLHKDALRVALKRSNETLEERELRRLKDRIRSANRRREETPLQAHYRRNIESLRSAFRRRNETEEQRRLRQQSDSIRAARRKLMETKEQRENRLQIARIKSTIEPDLQDEPEIKIETTTNTETSDPLDIFVNKECAETYLDISKIKFQTEDFFNTIDEQTQNRKSAGAQRKAFNRAKETQEQRRQRLHKDALRVALKRSNETLEEKMERRRKNAERTAMKRKMEPEDKREMRLLKDRIRSANRRRKDAPEQAHYRHYIQQPRLHHHSGSIRAARRKLMENKGQRENHLRIARERTSRQCSYCLFSKCN